MKKYLVGGAVRDRLLSLPVHERDWVVVGATPEQLLQQGYRQVGKDFPVFLHPHTHEEYALARTERKSGLGHRGFDIFSSPDISLEDDLRRRDLTINAIAQDENGILTDPFNGQKDIDKRILRHVSAAFAEDPLRVLRVARFAAKFWSLGFTIAPETLALMTSICNSGELEHLSKERIWHETERALSTSNPEIFIHVLMQTGALERITPELHQSLSKKTSLLRLSRIKHINAIECRYVCLVLLACQAEDTFNIEIADTISHSLACPGNLHKLTRLCVQFFSSCCNLLSKSEDEIYHLLHALDAFRRQSRCMQVIKCMQCAQPVLNQTCGDSLTFMEQLIESLNSVSLDENKRKQLQGKAIGEAIKRLRIKEIRNQLQRLNKDK